MEEPPPRLVGACEIRLLMHGISRQRVYQLTKHKDFPEPVAGLAQGKIWLADEVEAWIATRATIPRTPRRPRAKATKRTATPDPPPDSDSTTSSPAVSSA